MYKFQLTFPLRYRDAFFLGCIVLDVSVRGHVCWSLSVSVSCLRLTAMVNATIKPGHLFKSSHQGINGGHFFNFINMNHFSLLLI